RRGGGLLLAAAAAAGAAARPLLRGRGRLLAVAGGGLRLVLVLLLDLDVEDDGDVGRLRRLRVLARRRPARPSRALGLGLGGERLVGPLDRREQLGPGEPLGDGGNPRGHLLADELRGAADGDVDVADLAGARLRVVQADLAELQLDLLADLDRELRRDLLERALLEHDEVVEVRTLLADKEEPAAGRVFELAEPRAGGA